MRVQVNFSDWHYRRRHDENMVRQTNVLIVQRVRDEGFDSEHSTGARRCAARMKWGI